MRSRKAVSRSFSDTSAAESQLSQPHEQPLQSRARERKRADRVRLAVRLGWEVGTLQNCVELLEENDALAQNDAHHVPSEILATNERTSLHEVESIIRLLSPESLRKRAIPRVNAIVELIENPATESADIWRAILSFHAGLNEVLNISGLAKAYGIGRDLALMSNLQVSSSTLRPFTGMSLDEAFDEQKVATLTEWVLELKGYLPEQSALVVEVGLRDWSRSVRAANAKRRQSLTLLIREQAEIWKQLLSGEIDPVSVLSDEDYSKVSLGFARSLRRLILAIVVRLAPYAILVAAVVGALVWEMQRVSAITQSERLIVDFAAAGIGAGSLYLLGSTLVRKTVAPVEKALWESQLAERISTTTVIRAKRKLAQASRHATAEGLQRELALRSFEPKRLNTTVTVDPNLSEVEKPHWSVDNHAVPVVDVLRPEVPRAEVLRPDVLRPEVPSAVVPSAGAPSAGVPSAEVPGAAVALAQPPEEIEQQIPVARTSRRRLQRRRRWRIVLVVVLLLAALAAIRLFAVQSFSVVSGSMAPTLGTGDRILVDTLPFVRDSIHTGDIVVFRKVPADTTPGVGPLLVKRVIGLPGQRISSIDDTVYINGVPLNEVWLPNLLPSCAESSYNIPTQVIPAGRYFMLGDCRGFSSDSRSWGTVPAGNIVGKVFNVYWRSSHPWFQWF